MAGAADGGPTRRAAWAIALLLGVGWAVTLVTQALHGRFSSDECYHATVAMRIAATHRIPAAIPELYSGFAYYYQPLLHLIGALVVTLAGPGALHVLPVVFVLVIPVLFAFAAPRGVRAETRVAAILLCLTSTLLADYAVRLYVEGLTALEFGAAAVGMLRQRETGARRDALALGVITGLALLTKFTGWLLLAPIAGFALADLARGERRRAADLALAALLAVAIAAPWLVRDQLVLGSAFYPAFAPDLDPVIYRLNVAKFGVPPFTFIRGIPIALGLPLTLASLAALGAGLARRDRSPAMGLLVFGLAGALSVAFSPLAAPRHLAPFVPVLALASVIVLRDALAPRRGLAALAAAALVTVAAWTVFTPADHRDEADEPEFLVPAWDVIRAHVPADATVLSLWTYDTYYYTGRAATWPVPWGQRRRPSGMFDASDPAATLAALRRSDVDFVLAPVASRDSTFDGANYPESFIRHARTLAAGGALRVAWSSRELVLLEVPPASR